MNRNDHKSEERFIVCRNYLVILPIRNFIFEGFTYNLIRHSNHIPQITLSPATGKGDVLNTKELY